MSNGQRFLFQFHRTFRIIPTLHIWLYRNFAFIIIMLKPRWNTRFFFKLFLLRIKWCTIRQIFRSFKTFSKNCLIARSYHAILNCFDFSSEIHFWVWNLSFMKDRFKFKVVSRKNCNISPLLLRPILFFFVTIKPKYSSFFSIGPKNFKNVIFEKIGWALFEVAEVAHMKLSRIKKLKALCSKNFSKLAQKW